MQQPSLSRAVPMGVLGFLMGAGITIVVRALQSITPIWAVGPGIVFGTIFCAIAFVWGMGAFDPRMSEHHDPSHVPQHDDHADEAPKPFGILSNSIWQLSFLTILLLVSLAVMSQIGPTLITTDENAASVRDVGYMAVTIGEQELQVSTLTMFVIFVIFTLFSLLVTAGIMGIVFTFLSQGVAEAKVTATAAKAAASGGTVSEPAVGPVRPLEVVGRSAGWLARKLRGSGTDGTEKNTRRT
jgi:hypothetical protein